jgi:hypothetical protein
MWLSILLWTYKWKFAKARIFDINQMTNKIEWHLKWFYLYGARLDSIMARVSDAEIKMAKTRN